ncbi:hypothetical protein HJG60_009481 [Phyllostomus discolor]|uniref:Uncharacterized protein n=1 Tax=Phyllostomus discolor TaxID=89673 RepID=A0A833YJT6_9CHIR|nr:hypothetical protein HJG60_009481 [Phyllostomus discolor]
MVKVTPAGPSHSPFVPLLSTCSLQPRLGALQSRVTERGAGARAAGWVPGARPSPRSSSAVHDHPGESTARGAGARGRGGRPSAREGDWFCLRRFHLSSLTPSTHSPLRAGLRPLPSGELLIPPFLSLPEHVRCVLYMFGNADVHELRGTQSRLPASSGTLPSTPQCPSAACPPLPLQGGSVAG